MCGIAGIFSNDKFLVQKISSMVESMKHRGPDEKGLWESEYFSFGMSRLSILDVQNGSQPMWFKKIGLIFNGEIYNYKELNEKLCIKAKEVSDTKTLMDIIVSSFVKSSNISNPSIT